MKIRKYKLITLVSSLMFAAGIIASMYMIKGNNELKVEAQKTIEAEYGKANESESREQDENTFLEDEKIKESEEDRAKAETAAEARTEKEEREKQQAIDKTKNTQAISATPAPAAKPKPVPSTSPKPVPVPSSKLRPDIPTKYAFEYLQAVENQIVVLCNEERAKVGANPLSMNETLRQSARYKSDEMLQYNYFDHKSPITGFLPWELAKTFGYAYKSFGENIWYGQGYAKSAITAKVIVDGWMNSPGHRENILNGAFGRIGVGLVYSSSNNKVEATQQFSN